MLKSLTSILLIIFSFLSVSGQKKNDNFNYFIRKTYSPVVIDGIDNEDAWKECQVASDFFQVLPMDTSKAMVTTKVKFCYDNNNLYLLFINENYTKGQNIVESMKRDWNFNKNDNNLLFFDPFNDLTNGFTFGSNARGGQWDGLMSNGSAINLSWENKWKSEVKFDNDKWVWEAAIPFKTLRYKADGTVWGLNFSRLDLKTTEKSVWAPVPRQFPTSSLAFSGNLVWDAPPPSPGQNVAFIPFLTAGLNKNQEKNGKLENDLGIGLDAKYGITSALNLDLTVRPDFSQVEVDVQQTNLDRFELFFPERRQFFLENGDIFNNFGSQGLRPFFSRRIGLNAPINVGAKLSGKLNKTWRIGIINMRTGISSTNDPGSNYFVASAQKQVFKRSYIAAIFTDRETINNQAKKENINKITNFNRTAGIEYNLASADNRWKGKAFYFKTFSPETSNQNNSSGINLERSNKKYSVSVAAESVDKDVKGNEIGFIRRTNYNTLNQNFSYLFFPKGGKILSHGPQAFSSFYFSKNNNSQIENTNFIGYKVLMRKQATFTIWTASDFVRLQNKLDPTNFTGAKLDSGSLHRWRSWGTIFSSQPQSLFTYGFETRYGGYFADGKRLRLEGEMAYRWQPFVSVALKGSLNRVSFDDNAKVPDLIKNKTYNIWLVGPRIDVTLSNKIFFTNFIQYNNQINNVNVNARFQWRYSPASDLYLVYTDNYTADNFTVKNRAIVLKFTYWWNV